MEEKGRCPVGRWLASSGRRSLRARVSGGAQLGWAKIGEDAAPVDPSWRIPLAGVSPGFVSAEISPQGCISELTRRVGERLEGGAPSRRARSLVAHRRLEAAAASAHSGQRQLGDAPSPQVIVRRCWRSIDWRAWSKGMGSWDGWVYRETNPRRSKVLNRGANLSAGAQPGRAVSAATCCSSARIRTITSGNFWMPIHCRLAFMAGTAG